MDASLIHSKKFSDGFDMSFYRTKENKVMLRDINSYIAIYYKSGTELDVVQHVGNARYLVDTLSIFDTGSLEDRKRGMEPLPTGPTLNEFYVHAYLIKPGLEEEVRVVGSLTSPVRPANAKIAYNDYLGLIYPEEIYIGSFMLNFGAYREHVDKEGHKLVRVRNDYALAQCSCDSVIHIPNLELFRLKEKGLLPSPL